MVVLDDVWRDVDRRLRMGAGPADVALDPAAWVVVSYRLGRAIEALPKPLRLPLRALHRPVNWMLRRTTRVDLPLGAEIGGGLYVPHTGNVAVADGARLGRDCQLGSGAAVNARDAYVGDRVCIGPGARIERPVRVGNDAAIGAGAVVREDVPDGGAVGAAAGTSVVRGRKRPELRSAVNAAVRRAMPKPVQLLLRAP